jgi:hypothetical protein
MSDYWLTSRSTRTVGRGVASGRLARSLGGMATCSRRLSPTRFSPTIRQTASRIARSGPCQPKAAMDSPPHFGQSGGIIEGPSHVVNLGDHNPDGRGSFLKKIKVSCWPHGGKPIVLCLVYLFVFLNTSHPLDLKDSFSLQYNAWSQVYTGSMNCAFASHCYEVQWDGWPRRSWRHHSVVLPCPFERQRRR